MLLQFIFDKYMSVNIYIQTYCLKYKKRRLVFSDWIYKMFKTVMEKLQLEDNCIFGLIFYV